MTSADPVADRSGFLCTYMSTHPDTLVAYVKHFGQIDGNVSFAKTLSIDSKARTASPCRIGAHMAMAMGELLGNGHGIQDERRDRDVVEV
jgi:hypothetical protein